MEIGTEDPGRGRRTLAVAIAATLPFAIALWLALRLMLPSIPGMEEPAARLAVALGCVGLAVLLAFLPGIEAVAHERLFSLAVDPLAGHETRRLRVNLRYLQNTLEQLVVFAVGLLMLAWYCEDGGAMRAVIATTIVWIAGRWAFWVGYHRSSLHRAWGAFGVLQSMIVLLYAVYRFGESLLGPAGGLAPLLLFLGIEAYLFVATSRPSAR